MISIFENNNITIYSGYGFSVSIRDYHNPITNTAKKDISVETENRLVGIKYLENKEEFMLSFPGVSIKSELFSILNEELKKAENFISEVNEIIKKT